MLNVYVRFNDTSGAFKADPPFYGITNATGTYYTASNVARFNASRSSTVYGSSYTVTPLSLITCYMIKYV